MTTIKIHELTNLMKMALIKVDVPEEDAQIVADIYTKASFRGVGHHDVYDFFGRIDRILDGRINPKAQMKNVKAFGGMEVYDGDNGLGELSTARITERAIELAKVHGISYTAVKNSNHFLAAAPYAEIADDAGMLAIVMSKSPSGISLPGADKNLIGNNPFGFAAGYEDGRILFDICSAYASYGKTKQMTEQGKKMPAYWGNDKDGNPTEEPKELLESGLYMPIGLHKGFGLAMMVELFSSILADGEILNSTGEDHPEKGIYTQSVIAIDISKLMDIDQYHSGVSEMVNGLRALYPDIYIPGERSVKIRKEIEEKGYFEIETAILEKLNQLS